MTTMSPALTRVLGSLKNVKQSPDGWMAACPAHDDETPSLSIRAGRDGVLLKCHAQCETSAVVAAAGLSMKDLFDGVPATNGHGPRPVRGTGATYRYEDEHGRHLFDVVRLDPKGFYQRAASGARTMDGVRRVPYRLPHLVAAVSAGRLVFIVEGEKDVDALVALDLVATTNAGGAGKWRAEYNEYFRGARVVVLPDNDAPGRSHAQDVARQLFAVAKSVRIVALPDVPEKGDVSDWLTAGGTVAALRALVRNVPALVEPPSAENGEHRLMAPPAADLIAGDARNGVGVVRIGAATTNGTNGERHVDHAAVDLRFAVRPVVVCLGGVTPERVSWLAPGFLPLAKFVLLEGDPGQGKSTFSLDIAARITRGQSVLGAPAHGPRNVVLVTYEDGLADTVRPRVDALGGDPDRVFVFRGITVGGDRDTERAPTFPDDIHHLKAIVKEHSAALVIVDPLGAALSEGTDSHKDAAVRRVVSQLARVSEDTGACMLGVRHLIKGAASNAVRAGGGSIAFIGQARVALLVSEHPDDSEKPQHERRRVLATVKNNLAPHPTSRMFELFQPDGHEHPRLRWLGETPLSADDLNAAHGAAAPEERDAATARADWLREVLSAGALDSKELFRLARAEGFPDRTLRRTAHAAGVLVRREGVGRSHRTMWEISPLRPPDCTPATPACQENVAGVAGVDAVDLDVAL